MVTLQSPLQLRKRFHALRSPTLGEWVQGLQVGARESLRTLSSLQGTLPEQLVAFYRVVSPWCDMGSELYELDRKLARIDYGQYLKARQALVALAAQDERDLYGVNRTHSGEPPTAENIFLGNRCGLSTKTVDYWERKRGDYTTQPALIGRSDSPTIMGVIDAQASNLLAYGLDQWTPLLQDLIDS